eukprot:6204409-Pleurochrysis_carterae.AAC.1
MPLVGGAGLNGNASGDPNNLQFDRPYRASPTGLGPSVCVAAHNCLIPPPPPDRETLDLYRDEVEGKSQIIMSSTIGGI